ncbi:unnamed protein product [Soboliphyme baturini]|uniref:Uncharacterized protein n=1 Tax=Soboliphyme baturini TaxID=241478 RepID=A0A183J2Z2_9BILA|nr:unnamed protein product [Soboliphyme baturini]
MYREDRGEGSLDVVDDDSAFLLQQSSVWHKQRHLSVFEPLWRSTRGGETATVGRRRSVIRPAPALPSGDQQPWTDRTDAAAFASVLAASC